MSTQHYNYPLSEKLISSLKKVGLVNFWGPKSLPTVFTSRTLIDIYKQNGTWGTSLFNNVPLFPNENILIYCHDVNQSFWPHRHDFVEIIFVNQGKVINVIDGDHLHMRQGDFCILNPNAEHGLKCPDKNATIVKIALLGPVFQGTLCSFYNDDNPISTLIRGQDTNKENYLYYTSQPNFMVQRIINSIINEYTNSDFQTSFTLEAYLILLFSYLNRQGQCKYYSTDEFTMELLDYIREHCAYQNLDEIAEHFGYTPNYMTRLIKKLTGHNYSQIVKESRLQASLNYLSNSDLPVNEIAEKVGYNSTSHFFKVFKEYFGFTPSAYR